MPRTLAATVLGVASCLLGLGTGVLLFFLAVSPVSVHHAAYYFPLAAAIVQLCSICTLVILIYLQIWRFKSLQKVRGRVLIMLLGVLPSLVSAALVGASLGWAESFIVTKGISVLGSRVSTFLTLTFIVWGANVLAHLSYYFTLAWILNPATKATPPRFSIDDTNGVPQEMTETNRSATGATVQSNPFQEPGASSESYITRSDGASSFRSSFSTIHRPSDSKRGLVNRQASRKQGSRASSSAEPSARPSQDDGFDSWDSSGVSLQIWEGVLQAKAPIKASGLEPIPGSRSPSPAKILEGPFFQTSPSNSPPPSPLPQPTVSQPNSAPTSPTDRPPNLPNFSTMFPPPSPPPSGPPPATPRQHSFSRPPSRPGPVSRSGSVAMPGSRQGSRSRAPSEDHIHPLFRTSSPTPPPSASANTTVTAAPEGGQVINQQMLKRMRSGSLPSNPSPLVRSGSSPDVRKFSVPQSPSLDTMPDSFPGGMRPARSHQRKRSASFQSSVSGS